MELKALKKALSAQVECSGYALVGERLPVSFLVEAGAALRSASIVVKVRPQALGHLP